MTETTTTNPAELLNRGDLHRAYPDSYDEDDNALASSCEWCGHEDTENRHVYETFTADQICEACYHNRNRVFVYWRGIRLREALADSDRRKLVDQGDLCDLPPQEVERLKSMSDEERLREANDLKDCLFSSRWPASDEERTGYKSWTAISARNGPSGQ